MQNIRILLIFMLAIINTSYSQKSVLFIGNSLTYFNKMPVLFNKICISNNKTVNFKMVAYPGFSLRQHVTCIVIPSSKQDYVFYEHINENDTIIPEAVKELKSRNWDYIYLQDRCAGEDSISFAVGYIKELAPYSKILLFENYMPDSKWSKKYDRKKKKKNHILIRNTAKLINAEILPISKYYEKFKEKYPDDLLYDETLHPTQFGSLIIAITLYRSIFPHEKFLIVKDQFNINKQEWLAVRKIFSQIIID